MSIQQTYYTQGVGGAVRSAVRDGRRRAANATNFSPILISVPGHADERDQRDVEHRVRQPVSRAAAARGERQLLRGRIGFRRRLGWSKQAFIPQLLGFNDPANLTQTLTGRRTSTRATTSSAASTAFNYDVPARTMLQQQHLGVLQLAVLRPRVPIPDVELRRHHVGTPCRRPSLLPVVHAGGPRQLLAVQRRDERRHAVMRPPSSPARPDSPAATCSISSPPPAPTSSRGIGPARRAPRQSRGVRGRRSTSSTRRGHGTQSPSAKPDGRVSLRRRRARRHVVGEHEVDASRSTCVERITLLEGVRRARSGEGGHSEFATGVRAVRARR